MDSDQLIYQFITGLNRASIYFLMGAGMTLVLGVCHVLNMAHGSFFLLAAYIGYSLSQYLGDNGASYWIILIITPVTIGIIAAIIEFILLRRIYHRELLDQIVLTFALVYIFTDIMLTLWGGAFLIIPKAAILEGSFQLFSNYIPTFFLFTIVLSAFIAIVLGIVLNWTKYGKLVRATAQDRNLAASLGINSNLLFSSVFAIGTALAGLAGVVSGSQIAIAPGVDMTMVLFAFIVVIVGGLGSVRGALLGALIIGLVEAFGILFISQFALLFIYVIMAAVLMFRPNGLLGKAM